MGYLCQLFAVAPTPSVKGRLGLPEHDVADDAVLTQLMGWVTERFEHHCGRVFERAEDATEEFDGDCAELLVRRSPIESISAWHLKSNETDGWVAQSDVDYLIRAGAVVSLSSPLGSMRDRLRITFDGGYVLPGTTPDAGQTALPADLEGAAIEQVAHWYQRRHQLGLSGVTGEGGSISTPTRDLLESVLNTLQPHRRLMHL